MNTKEFIEISNKIHGYKYSYDKTKYVNKRTKVVITCPIHGDFEQLPSNHKNGQGCPKCGHIKAHSKFCYTQFLQKAHEKFGNSYSFPNIKDEYKTNRSKITIKCEKCGTEFIKTAIDFLQSKYGGCDCYRFKTYTFTDLVSATKLDNIVYFDGVKRYKGDKITLSCPIHGEYTKTLGQILEGDSKCQKCSVIQHIKEGVSPIDEVKEKLLRLHPSISIVDDEEYENLSSKITFKCNICGKTFKRLVTKMLNENFTNSCPHCSKTETSKKRTKTTEDFINDTNMVYGEGKYTVIGEYTSSNSKIEIKCNECGRHFKIEANSFLQGHGCPYHYNKTSVQEEELYAFIEGLCPDSTHNVRNIIDNYELDVYIPSKKTAIEYDGLYWHCELKKDKGYHLEKTQRCNEKNIRLIHIFEDEWLYRKNMGIIYQLAEKRPAHLQHKIRNYLIISFPDFWES